MRISRFIAAAGLIAAGLAAAGATTGAVDVQAANHDPVRCEIVAERTGSMVRLAGLMHADREISGEYRFDIRGGGTGGNTNIRQGSTFHAGPSGPTTLGMAMLSAGGSYQVDLDVTANGRTYSCAERIG